MSIKSFAQKVRSKLSKKTVALVAATIIGVAGLAGGVQVARAERPDCDGNAVMYCGAYDTTTLRNKYNSNSSTRAIYAGYPFGISSSVFYGSLGSMQNGYVTRDNKVVVGGRVVATNAWTAGRHYIPGSYKMNGVSAYYRHPSVSFKQYSLQAFVKFDSAGKFQFAIIKACGNPVTGTPTPPPTPVAKPGMKIEKKVRIAGSNSAWQENVKVVPGQKIEYVIGVTNTGNTTLTNVNVRDALPTGVAYVANSTRLVTSYGVNKPITGVAGATAVNIGNMPAGSTAFIFLTATAPAANDTRIKVCDTGATTLRNMAYVKPDQLPRQENPADINTCRPTKPDFKIEKKVKKANTQDQFAENVKVAPGTELTFVVAVQNTGNTALKNILVKDVLPAGMTYVPGTATITTSEGIANQKISDSLVTTGYKLSSLGVGHTAFIFFNAKMPAASNPVVKECQVGTTHLVNKASATPEGQPTKTDDASADTCKEVHPNFTIEKSVAKKGSTSGMAQTVTVKNGDVVSYQITVKNTGDTDLTNVKITDRRPVGADFISGTAYVWTRFADGSHGDPKRLSATEEASLFGVGYNIDRMKPGQIIYISYDAKITAPQDAECQTRTLKNVASAQPTGLNIKSDDAVVTAECVPPVTKNPKVDITKMVDGVDQKQVEVGKPFTYQLIVKNTGDVDLKSVVVTDEAPAGVEFLSTDSGTITNNKLDYVIPELKVGESKGINIQAKVTAYREGMIVNTACVNAPEVNPGNPTQNDDCDTATVTVPEPEVPVYECTALEALSLGDLKYRFTPVVTAKNATLAKVTYNFGDNTPEVVRTDRSSVEHTFTQLDVDKTYTVVATVQFNVGGEIKGVKCQAQVKVTATPEEPCPYNPNIPKDSPNCRECKPGIPVGDERCEEKPPVVPPVKPEQPQAPSTPSTPAAPVVTYMPATGAAEVVGGLAGTSATAYGAYAFIQSRRNLKNIK